MIVHLDLKDANLFSPNEFGMRMSARRAGDIAGKVIELCAAVLAMVADRQHLHMQRRAFRNGAACDRLEDTGQPLEVHNTAGADAQANGNDSLRRVAVSRAIGDLDHVIRQLTLVHRTPSETPARHRPRKENRQEVPGASGEAPSLLPANRRSYTP